MQDDPMWIGNRGLGAALKTRYAVELEDFRRKLEKRRRKKSKK
jgi:hypothetical protein